MPDNVTLPGEGALIATDDVGGVQYQVLKIAFGADGAATLVDAVNGLPVAIVGSVAVGNFPATQAVTAAALPLPAGAATEASLAAVNGKLPALLTTVPDHGVAAQPVRPVGQDVWACSFAASGASVLSSDFTPPIVGSGVTYNQTAGALNILTGTTVNAEFLTRSAVSFRGSMRLRASVVASQRIANQNLAILLADLLGEGLAFTINSATSVTVTLTGHTFTAQSVGQFINLGGIVGAAGVPGRYAIASVATDAITFTVAGWPASGSGTLTLFGYSFVRHLVTGTTPTALNWTTQRRGWADADTVAAINSTAAPGTILQTDLTGRDAFLSDTLRASTGAPTVTARASRYENLPDDDTPLFLFLWSFNGTVAPASSTTWTLGFLSVEVFSNQPVYLQGNRAVGAVNPIPVSIQGTVDTEFAVAAALADGTANPTTGTAGAAQLDFNGATWDRRRANTSASVEASSAKVASGNSAAALTNHSGRGAVFFINVSAITGTTPSLTLRVQMQDPVGSGWVDIPGAVTAAITATGVTILAVYPGATPVANQAVSYPLPRVYRLAWVIAGTTPSITFSVGAQIVT